MATMRAEMRAAPTTVEDLKSNQLREQPIHVQNVHGISSEIRDLTVRLSGQLQLLDGKSLQRERFETDDGSSSIRKIRHHCRRETLPKSESAYVVKGVGRETDGTDAEFLAVRISIDVLREIPDRRLVCCRVMRQ